MLTKRNKELHNSFLEMRGMYILLKRRNLRYMKENTRLYRMIRLMRLQVKNARPNPSTHFSLETLVEAAVSLQNPESIQVAADPPNDEQVEEGRKVSNRIEKCNLGRCLKILQEQGFRWLRRMLKQFISHRNQDFQ